MASRLGESGQDLQRFVSQSPWGFRARRGPLLSPEPKALFATAQSLPAAAWKKVIWRRGTKRPANMPVEARR